MLELDPEFLTSDGEHKHDDRVSSCSIKIKGEMNFSRVQMFLRSLISTPEKANSLYRYKGVLAVRGMKTKFVFQGVHMILSGNFSEDVEFKVNETRESIFVFIGRNLDKDMLTQGFKACVSEDTLRFKVGDYVQCKLIGRWWDGVIIKIWDEGQPYKVKLDERGKIV